MDTLSGERVLIARMSEGRRGCCWRALGDGENG